jgi:hypothetical protein
MKGFNLRKVGVVLAVLAYAVFLGTWDIQEDAFILFRNAFNLADHGQWSFNLGEHYNSATSFLYPLLVALIRLVFRQAAIGVVLAVNAAFIVLSANYLGSLLEQALGTTKPFRRLLIPLSFMPVALLLSVRGMEAVYVIFLFVLGLHWIQTEPQMKKSLIPIFLLPLVRPDALAYSLLLAFFLFWKSFRLGWRGLLACATGIFVLVGLNQLFFGHMLPATIQAKSTSLMGEHSLSDVLACLKDMFFYSALFAPFSTKYLLHLYPFFTVGAFLLSLGLLVFAYLKNRRVIPLVVTMILAIWTVPAAYAVGGVVHEWYLWPSQFLYQSLLYGLAVYAFLHLTGVKRWILLPVLGILALATSYQVALSYSKGTQEYRYRASVGKYLRSVAVPSDKLFLEPAGYIPFYAGCFTIDEVGLTSPIILSYRTRSPDHWWIEAVKTEQPEFLVQRDHILEGVTSQGYEFTSDERRWFDHHYTRIKSFHYEPSDYTQQRLLLKILRHGDHANYHVYRLNKSEEKADDTPL